MSDRGGQRPHHLAVLLVGEIDLDGALAAVDREVVAGLPGVLAVPILEVGRAPAARVVAGALALHLDHVGAEIGEDLAGPGACHDAAQVEHANMRKRAAHHCALRKSMGETESSNDAPVDGRRRIVFRIGPHHAWPTRHLRVPLGERREGFAPMVLGETEVELADGADDGGVAYAEGRGRQPARFPLESGKACPELPVEGGGHDVVGALRPHLLVAPQEQDVGHAVAQRLPAQLAKARSAALGQHTRAGMQRVEIFADHRRVEEAGAVVEHQRRDLAERVVLQHVLVRFGGVGHHRALALHTVEQARFVQHDHDLSDERRARRPVQLHGTRSSRNSPSARALGGYSALSKLESAYHKVNLMDI